MSILVLNVLAANSPAVSACQPTAPPPFSHISSFLSDCHSQAGLGLLLLFAKAATRTQIHSNIMGGKGSTGIYPVLNVSFDDNIVRKGGFNTVSFHFK